MGDATAVARDEDSPIGDVFAARAACSLAPEVPFTGSMAGLGWATSPCPVMPDAPAAAGWATGRRAEKCMNSAAPPASARIARTAVFATSLPDTARSV